MHFYKITGMKRLWIYGFIAVLFIGCSTKKKNTNPFKISIPDVVVKANQKGTLNIEINILGHYHFNKDYPAKVKIIKSDTLKFDSNIIKKDGFKIQEKNVKILIPFKAPNKPGSYKPQINLDFSICADKECLIFKQIKKVLNVRVRRY